MPGVMNNELMEIEDNLLKENLQILKLLGAGAGGFFLVKSKHKSIKEVQSKLKKFSVIKKERVIKKPQKVFLV